MKRYLLAAKIAAVFTVTTWLFVILALHLFSSMVLHSHEHRSMHEAHSDFMMTVLWVGLGASALMTLFSVYVTRHLRRMSQSMNRIAAGDLDHRVSERGRDEGAAMARSFNAMADKVQGMVTGQRELMAGVSHELRSPLTRMKVSLAMLREENRGGSRVEALEQEVDALDELVGELLLASRLELQGLAQSETVALGELCLAAWQRVAAEAGDQGVRLDLTARARDARLTVDRRLFERILGNLFENAVRYAGKGVVTVDAENPGSGYRVTVEDQGPGVAEPDLARLFEPFFRADRSRARSTGAEGLGLMIVRRAMEAHGGSASAQRGSTGGLRVVLRLPAPGVHSA